MFLNLKNTLLLKLASHHLSFQQVIIFLLLEGLKCCEKYQKETQSEQMPLEKWH